jgi:hypothetical protein
VANSTLYRVYTTGPEEVSNDDSPVAGASPFTVLE